MISICNYISEQTEIQNQNLTPQEQQIVDQKQKELAMKQQELEKKKSFFQKAKEKAISTGKSAVDIAGNVAAPVAQALGGVAATTTKYAGMAPKLQAYGALGQLAGRFVS